MKEQKKYESSRSPLTTQHMAKIYLAKKKKIFGKDAIIFKAKKILESKG